MIESVQSIPKSPEGVFSPPVNESPSLQELFQQAQDIAKEVQTLIGGAHFALQNQATSLEKAFEKTAEELQKGLGEGVKNMQAEFFKALTGLNAIFEGAKVRPGLVGGPSTVHPRAFKAQIENLKGQLETTLAQTPEESKALKELASLIEQLAPAYEAYIGAGIHYPSAEQTSIRYVDINGNEISKEQFEQIKADFIEALEKTTQAFLEDTSNRVQAIVSTLFTDVEGAINNVSV